MSIPGKVLEGIGSAAIFGAKQTGKFALGAGIAMGRTAQVAGKAAFAVGKPIVTSAGSATMKFFGGAGTVLSENLRDPNARGAIASSLASKAKTLGNKFVTGDRDNMRISAFGLAALTGAAWVDNGRDLYDKNTSRNMGAIDNQKTTNTPSLAIPQYDFSPQKRMGALDGGASGALVFALRNNR